jgi:hypothetical protein
MAWRSTIVLGALGALGWPLSPPEEYSLCGAKKPIVEWSIEAATPRAEPVIGPHELHHNPDQVSSLSDTSLKKPRHHQLATDRLCVCLFCLESDG